MQLDEALSRIGEIHARLEVAERFRGYRALPVAGSGLLAVLAAAMQPLWVSDPRHEVEAYLGLWIVVAAVSVGMISAAMLLGLARERSPAARARTRSAVGQFVPCITAGGLLTILFAMHMPEHAWMLPGLWQILFSQGVFASARLLPRAAFGIGALYLLSGLAVLVICRGDLAYSPWAMGLPFGVGQFAGAALLYWTLERHDE